MDGIKSLKDIGYLISISAGSLGVEAWIQYARDKYKFSMGGACTAITEPGLRPYLSAGQLTGIVGAMKGAAEYESLINHLDKGTAGIAAISIGQLLIVFFIIIGNIAYIVSKGKK
jgi:hypothetical protein